MFSTETAAIAKRIVTSRDKSAARQDAARRAAHAIRVAAYNAQLLRTAGVHFQVIEVSTGRAVGGGKSFAYSFAKYVRDTRDLFNTGAFLVKRCS